MGCDVSTGWIWAIVGFAGWGFTLWQWSRALRGWRETIDLAKSMRGDRHAFRQ